MEKYAICLYQALSGWVCATGRQPSEVTLPAEVYYPTALAFHIDQPDQPRHTVLLESNLGCAGASPSALYEPSCSIRDIRVGDSFTVSGPGGPCVVRLSPP